MDIQLIKNYEEIFIYGKGKIGKIFLEWIRIQQLDDKVCGFVVSHVDDENVCMGKPVIEVEQVLHQYKQARIIISVKEKFRSEIIDTVRQCGLTDYIVLSNEMIEECSRLVLRLRPRTALKFEVHVAEHCNLNCRGCYHCSPLAKEEFLSIEEFEKDCTRLSKLYHGRLESLQLLGGEPLLHPDIIDFFRIARTCFTKGKISLVTNGVLLPKMKEEFWIAAREYDIEFRPTHYPIHLDYASIQKKAETYGICYRPFSMVTDDKGNKILENHHFDIDGKQPVRDNFNKCHRGNVCIYLSHGKLYSCVVGANIRHFKDYFGLEQIEIAESNAIDIYSVESGEEISEFLTQPMPICRYCKLAEEKTYLPYQGSKRQMDEWL